MSSTTSRDILLQVEDINAATKFYEQLGMKLFMTEPAMHGLEAGAFRLFLEKAPSLGPVLEIFVENVAAKKIELVAQGCRIVADDPGIPKCYVQHPFGLIFNIAER